MILLLWNCRGAANIDFLIAFKDLIAFHRPQVVVLTKMKVVRTREDNIFGKLGFNNFIKSDLEGLSRGLAILWQDTVHVHPISSTPQELHLKIQISPSSSFFSISHQFTKPYINDYHDLWANLLNFSKTCLGPWLVGGDFNQIFSPLEKRGGKPAKNSAIDTFHNYIAACDLFNLGCKGPMYTWTNNRFKNRTHLIQERLDRFLSNQTFLDIYPNVQVYHLAHYHSNHCPLLLHLTPYNPPHKGFKLEHMWLDHPSFPELISRTWTPIQDYLSCLQSFQRDAVLWNKQVYGNIFLRKKNILARLKGIQKFFETKYSLFLANLPEQLIKEYNTTLTQEMDFWKIKSRILGLMMEMPALKFSINPLYCIEGVTLS